MKEFSSLTLSTTFSFQFYTINVLLMEEGSEEDRGNFTANQFNFVAINENVIGPPIGGPIPGFSSGTSVEAKNQLNLDLFIRPPAKHIFRENLGILVIGKGKLIPF